LFPVLLSDTSLGHNLGTELAANEIKPATATQEKARRINIMLDFFQTLDLAILVRVQASQPNLFNNLARLPSHGLMFLKHGAVAKEVGVGVVTVDFEHFGDETASREAFDVNDDVHGVPNICFDGPIR